MSQYFKSFAVLFLSRWPCQSFLSSECTQEAEEKKGKKTGEKKKEKDRQARKRNKSTYRVPCRSCHSHSCRCVYTGTGIHLIVFRGPRRGYVTSTRHDEVLSGVMDMSPLSSGISDGIPGHSQYALLFTGQR